MTDETKNMCPKDKSLYEIAQDQQTSLLNDLKQNVIPKDYEDIIKMIRRLEYKRGKSDAITEIVNSQKPIKLIKNYCGTFWNANDGKEIYSRDIIKLLDYLKINYELKKE